MSFPTTEIWGCLLPQHNQVHPDGYNWEVDPQGSAVLVCGFTYTLTYYKYNFRTVFKTAWINYISQFMAHYLYWSGQGPSLILSALIFLVSTLDLGWEQS